MEFGEDLSGVGLETTMEAALGRFKGDNCRPEFYLKPVHFENKSEEAGRPVYQDVEYVRITIPGARNSVVDRKVRDEDKRRWPREYLAWKQSGTMATDGMPLEKWTLISPAEVASLKFSEVRTVEELANLSDTQTQSCGMGTLRLRGLAKDWLAQSRGNAGVSQLAAENKHLKASVELLQNQLADIVNRLGRQEAKAGAADAATETATPKRGRRKAAADAGPIEGESA